MFKLFSVLCLLFFFQGCSVTDSQLKTAQPTNVRYWKPDQQLFEIRAQKIMFEAPMITEIDKITGNTITKPVMITTKTYNKDGSVASETSEPVLAEFHAKDTSAKPPLTILDIVKSGLGYGVIYGLGYKMLGVIGVMSNGLSKDPMVIKQDAPRTDYIFPDKDGVTTINRG